MAPTGLVTWTRKLPANFLCLPTANTIWSRLITRKCGIHQNWCGPNDKVVETLDQIKTRVEAAVPRAQLQIIPNVSPAKQPSLLVNASHAGAVARWLRDDPQLKLDYASNVTGVDWLDTIVK